MVGGIGPGRAKRARANVGAVAVCAAVTLGLTGCLHGPGEFTPPESTASTVPPSTVSPRAQAAAVADPCSLLDSSTASLLTGTVLTVTTTAPTPEDEHAEQLPACRWASASGVEVSLLIDPTITDIDLFVDQATGDAESTGFPLTHLAVDGADLAFGGDGDGFAAVVIVLDGLVHQIIYVAPDDAGRLDVAQRLAAAVAERADLAR